MTIKVGSARIDENSKTTGGTAGDQTGGEVSTQNMYTHSKGWYIIRAKSATHAKKLAERMKTACSNDHIGYDQNQRLGVITYGIDTTTDTECDCSSLVRECVIEATGTDPGNFTTSTEATYLSKTGLFYDKLSYTSQSKTPVYNGDILVTKTKGHTVIVVSGSTRPSSLADDGTASTSSTTSTTTSTVPTYTTGKNYTTKVDRLRVRKGPGTSYAAVAYSALTANAKKHAYSNGTLKKGTTVTCKGTSKDSSGNVWMKIPSGYIAAYYNSSEYVG